MTDYLRGQNRWHFTCHYCKIRKNGDHCGGNHYGDHNIIEWCTDNECLEKHSAEYVIRDPVANNDQISTYVKKSTYEKMEQEEESHDIEHTKNEKT